MEDKEIILDLYKRYKHFILKGLYVNRPFYEMEYLWQDVLTDGLEAYLTVFDPSREVLPQTYLISRARWFAYRRVKEVRRKIEVAGFEDFICTHRETPLETLEILEMIMVVLPLRHRKILRLYKLGYTYKEIGVIMGLSKQRIHSIVEKVRKVAENLCFES